MDINLIFIFGGIILILFIIIIILIKQIKSKNINIDVAEKELRNIFEMYEFSKRELDRCKEQIKIYEKKDEEIKEITFNKNKKIKVNPIYRGKRALVGDYIDSSSALTQKILKSFGMTVDVVRSSDDIIDKIEHGYKCDIIFTNNIYKKGPRGPEMLEKLRDIDGFNIPVVIHTISNNERNYFVNICGFDEYVVKPLSQEKIKPILDKFLGSR